MRCPSRRVTGEKNDNIFSGADFTVILMAVKAHRRDNVDIFVDSVNSKDRLSR